MIAGNERSTLIDGLVHSFPARVARFSGFARRAEPGCLEYAVHRSTDDPRRYLIYERYIDRDALQNHLDPEHFRALALAMAYHGSKAASATATRS